VFEIEDRCSDLRIRYDFFEQRIGVSHTPISGGGEVQRICAQVIIILVLFLLFSYCCWIFYRTIFQYFEQKYCFL